MDSGYLAEHTGFTIGAMISLSLGICAGTSFFSELNGTVFRNVPRVSHPDDLVTLQDSISYPSYRRFSQLTDLFSSVTAYVAPVPFGVAVGSHNERIWGHLVTPSCFATLALSIVMKESAVLLLIGTTVGLAAAWTGIRLLASSDESVAQVTSNSASDPLLWIGIPISLSGLALATSFMPARKSTRVNPLLALREE
jgi:hypothetical protein